MRLTISYHPGYLAAVLARGNVFHAIGLTPLGGFYPSARKFITAVQHVGDTLPQWSDAARFEHDSITFVTPSHRMFVVHTVVTAMAKAAYRQAAANARVRLVDHDALCGPAVGFPLPPAPAVFAAAAP